MSHVVRSSCPPCRVKSYFVNMQVSGKNLSEGPSEADENYLVALEKSRQF